MAQQSSAQDAGFSVPSSEHSLFTNAPLGIIFTTPEGRLLSANPAMAKMFGYDSPDELIESVKGNNIQLYADPSDREELMHLLRDNEEVVNHECRGVHRDGSIIWISQNVSTVRDNNGKIIHFQSFITDITESKQLQDSLSRNERFLDAVLESVQDGISIVDQDLTIRRVNEVMRRWYAQNLPLEGKKCYAVYHNAHAPCSPCPTRRSFQSGRMEHEEISWLAGPSAQRIELFTYPIKNEDGQVDYVTELVRDISDRKQAEEALRQSENHYRAIFETSGTAMFIIEEDTTISLANSNFEELSGYSGQEIKGKKSWTEFAHPDDVAWMKENHYLRRQDPDAAPRQYEFRFVNRCEEILNVLLAVDMIPGTNQSIASAVDITERKRTEEMLQEQKSFIKLTLDNLPVGVAINSLNPQVDFTYMNDNFVKFYRTSREELSQKDFWEAVYQDPEFREKIKQRVLEDCASGDPERMYWQDVPVVRPGQETFYITAQNIPLPDNNLVVSTVWDVTDRKKTEEELRKSEHQFRQLFEQASIGIFIANAEHTIVEVNQTALSILGYSREEILQVNALDIIHPDDFRANSPKSNLQNMLSNETMDMERRFRTRQGDYIQALVNMAMLPYHNEEASHIVMFQDISERKQAEERIYHLAYYDDLTALPNRRLFYDRLKKVFAQPGYFGDGGAVFLVDITRLRDVNDTLGQKAGDELIMEVARRVSDSVFEEDTVARISGGEFLIFSKGVVTDDKARNLGERILERIGQRLELSGRLIYPDVNIGFTLFPQRGTDPETLIKQANMALSEAKKCVHSIQEFVGQEDWVSKQFHLEHDLKQALTNEEFFLCYQPQIDLRSGRIVGMEALLRWNHPERGVVSTGEFIPVLEHTGMIASADEWVIHRVCEQLRSWQDSSVSVKASVNISAQELGNDATIEVVRAALEENDVCAENLEVEITETSLMENVDRASWVLQTLSSQGVKVALDDFGKGYSSLSYLQQLAINIIKIDKQFVDGLPENQDSVTLVHTIIAMAHNLGKEVLAEGVEREEQRQKLLELGCDYGQGFLWSRPQPVEKLPFMES